MCNEWTARMLAPQLQAAVASGSHEAAAWSFFRRLHMLAAQAAKLNKQCLERSKADAERKRSAAEVSFSRPHHSKSNVWKRKSELARSCTFAGFISRVLIAEAVNGLCMW